jgi:Holliday junction resolvase RusA-like endonuclease
MAEQVAKAIYRAVIPGVPNRKIRHRDYLIKGTTRRVRVNPNKKAEERFTGLAIHKKPETPLTTSLKVNIVAVFPYLKSHYKKDGTLKPNVPQFKTSKPDVDNIAKFVFDALNGVFWKDDAIIVDSRIVKIYGKEPRTEITVMEIEDYD